MGCCIYAQAYTLHHRCVYMFAESLPEADFVVGFQNYSGLPTTLRNALQSTTSTSGHAEPRVQVRTLP